VFTGQYVTNINIKAETAASIARTMALPAAVRHLPRGGGARRSSLIGHALIAVVYNPAERVLSPETVVTESAEGLCGGLEIRQLVSGGDSGDEGTRGGFDAGIADET